MQQMDLPAGWVADAHAHWLAGNRLAAIDAVLAAINTRPQPIPHKPAIQFAYYLSMHGDWASAADVLLVVCNTYPHDIEALQNLCATLSRSGQLEPALQHLQRLIAEQPENPVVWDIKASVHSRQLDAPDAKLEAKKAGEKSLSLKNARTAAPQAGWQLPAMQPKAFVSQPGKRNVISFSLWGDNPRYLRGALQNALLAAEIYPGWTCRFHIDSSMPKDLLAALAECGAELVDHGAEPDNNLGKRLARRFWDANDQSVGYFLVRDCDSVISTREAAAVHAWLASARWFHVMRDWWTHTDLMLAGMWGGVAGVLPDLAHLFGGYRSVHLETPNWDQWFLRDCVWTYVRQSCLIHDRCFQVLDACDFPAPLPEGNRHVGQDEHAARAEQQADFLKAWAGRVPSLKLAEP